MGCGASAEKSEQNDEINKKIAEDRKRLQKEVKLLLLGAGESGKSTISKQMKIIHLNGFTEAELLGYKPILQSNAIETIKILVNACDELAVPIEGPNAALAEKFENVSSVETSLTPDMAAELKKLWNDASIQAVFQRRSEFQLPDSAKYVMDNIDRISTGNFVPSTEDVLRCRARTTGIHETEFDVNELHFRMVDVGGQRSERKKWAHCFQDVTAIMFCVAMNEYDMKLYEDENVNRMHEAIQLFDEICNSKWFKSTSMILFLNKSDLFKDKIQNVDMNVCFSDYTGGKSYKNGCAYLKRKFKKLNRRPNKQVYSHITCATDTENIKFVFEAAKDIIVTQAVGGNV